jgi:hypothetical protein
MEGPMGTTHGAEDTRTSTWRYRWYRTRVVKYSNKILVNGFLIFNKFLLF